MCFPYIQTEDKAKQINLQGTCRRSPTDGDWCRGNSGDHQLARTFLHHERTGVFELGFSAFHRSGKGQTPKTRRKGSHGAYYEKHGWSRESHPDPTSDQWWLPGKHAVPLPSCALSSASSAASSTREIGCNASAGSARARSACRASLAPGVGRRQWRACMLQLRDTFDFPNI